MHHTLTRRELSEPVAKYARNEVVTLNRAQTIGEALEQLRGKELGEQIVYLYVTDVDNRLIGVVPGAGDKSAGRWVELFGKLGEYLDVKIV